MATRIEIYCPTFDGRNPNWAPWWAGASVDDRAALLDRLAGAGVLGAADADPRSAEAPNLIYPPGHPCYGRDSHGDGSPGGWEGPDEGERARAAASLAARPGVLPGPGLGLVSGRDWLWWLAVGLIVLGAVVIVARRRAR